MALLKMSFWRKIAGLAVANLDEAECTDCPPGLPGEDPAFSTAVTALGAKLAKADGDAQAGEYQAFSEVFQPEPGAEGNVRRLYQLARQTTRGFEGYARRLARRYRNCPQLLEDVVAGLFYIAGSDGLVSPEELAYLRRVSDLFGISPLTFQRLKATYLGAESEDPYVILGVAPDADDEVVRKAWRAALSEAHPDRARARGLPTEFIEVAEAKAASINAAYDAILRDRKAMALKGAA
jgi:DnaJ like chaperone protein